MSIVVSLKLSSLNTNVLLAALIVATAGGILQIGGASWDVTSHILRQPETFFTPSHTLLYIGAGLTTIAAIIGIFISLKNKEEIRSRSFYTAFKLLIIGAAIQLISGPGDFMWHSVFGVDGLMSPPHLALATGILINAIAAVVGLARILPHIQSKRIQTLARTALVPAFAALWFSSIWYIFMFVLPLSNGEHFNFNPDPATAVVIATIALPFVSAMIFLISARTIGKLGAASAVAGVIISMNVLANIAPAYQSLGTFLPWQLLAIIPVIIAADIAIHRAGRRNGLIVAGALIGITFYIFNYPMLQMAFAEFLNQPNLSIDDILPSMYATLWQVIAMTAVPSVLAGIVGAVTGSKKIQMPQIDVAISRYAESEILTARMAKGLAIAALILFLISSIDAVTNAAGGQFLGLSTMVRGMIFGFGAVALATAAFFVSMKERSTLVSILLIVNGTLMAIAGMVSTRGLTLIALPGPIIFLFLGFWIIALGIVKSIRTRHERIIFSK